MFKIVSQIFRDDMVPLVEMQSEVVSITAVDADRRTTRFLAYLSRSTMSWRLSLSHLANQQLEKGADYVGNTTLHPALQAHIFANFSSAPMVRMSADLHQIGLVDNLSENEKQSLLDKSRWVTDDVLSALNEACSCGDFLSSYGKETCGTLAKAPFEKLAKAETVKDVFDCVGDALQQHFEVCDVAPVIESKTYLAGEFYHTKEVKRATDARKTFNVICTVTVWLRRKQALSERHNEPESQAGASASANVEAKRKATGKNKNKSKSKGKGKEKGKGNGQDASEAAAPSRVYAYYVRLVETTPGSQRQWMPLCLGAVGQPGGIPAINTFGVMEAIVPCGPLVCKPFEYVAQIGRFLGDFTIYDVLVSASDYDMIVIEFTAFIKARNKVFPKKLPPSLIRSIHENKTIEKVLIGDTPYQYIDIATHYQEMWPLSSLNGITNIALSGGARNRLPQRQVRATAPAKQHMKRNKQSGRQSRKRSGRQSHKQKVPLRAAPIRNRGLVG